MTQVGTLVIGGGPAGLAPLLAASRVGRLDALLRHGLAVVEQGSRIGSGTLGRYLIGSDSAAETFLSAATGHPDARIASLADHPVGRAMALFGRDPVPLRLASAFLDLLGGGMTRLLRERPGGLVLERHLAVQLRQTADGGWRATLASTATGAQRQVTARTVLLALGGRPASHKGTRIAGLALETLGDRVVHSDRVLTVQGCAEIERRLSSPDRRPRIVVLGGSTSAISVVRVLLERLAGSLDHGALTLMHRRPLKPWYRSAEAARDDGYHGFDEQDLCPLSGMVNRFGGLRFESGEIVRAALGLGGRALDPRIRLHRLRPAAAFGTPEDAAGTMIRDTADPADTCRLLREADLVVSALGYRPKLLPILDQDGSRLHLQADKPGGTLVGPDAAVMDGCGRPIRGLFGLGLAAGYRPHPAMGGEPSFGGQVNGLWLWQNDVGRMVAEHLLSAHDRRPIRSPGLFSSVAEDAA